MHTYGRRVKWLSLWGGPAAWLIGGRVAVRSSRSRRASTRLNLIIVHTQNAQDVIRSRPSSATDVATAATRPRRPVDVAGPRPSAAVHESAAGEPSWAADDGRSPLSSSVFAASRSVSAITPTVWRCSPRTLGRVLLRVNRGYFGVDVRSIVATDAPAV